MSIGKVLSVVLILCTVSLAWFALSGLLTHRTGSLDRRFSAEMASLWGPKVLFQQAPFVAYDSLQAPLVTCDDHLTQETEPIASEISAVFSHDHRHKGLLWYSTFLVDFTGRYTVASDGARPARFVFPLPLYVTSYDRLEVKLNGEPVEIEPGELKEGALEVPLPATGRQEVVVSCATRGQNAWLYAPSEQPKISGGQSEGDRELGVFIASGPLRKLNDFKLTITTDFPEIDYPKGTASPSAPAQVAGGGMKAEWSYPSAVTNQPMGVVMPLRPNAGPITARMCLFAPISLLFFTVVLIALVILKRIPLHPMHLLFISAGFFSFHILMSYLVDLMRIHSAFWISAAVSVFLVVTYMRLVTGLKFAVVYIGAAQFIYLIGFAYAFFWVGMTGLTVTIAAVVTLFLLMQATGRVDWGGVFHQLLPAGPPRHPVLEPHEDPTVA